MSIELRGL
ncbi:hypothetical protein VCHENC02_5104A, partial [Vibrio harveyi]